MENLSITPISLEQIPELAQLADEIWHEHFPPIIGMEQVEYMVEKFQSEQAVREAVQHQGYRYYFFCCQGKNVGYIGIQPQQEVLFLSKLYLKKEYRGKKIARAGIDFLTELCHAEGFSKIRLTCNRDNRNTLAAYDKMGFQVVAEQDADIGGGFVMNDYILEKNVV